jgi:RNA recognition motif-containing protein
LAKKLYVGNLPFSVTEADLRQLFEEYGTVEAVNVITDRDTGRPRGFAFVEMENAENADKAIQSLDGQDFGGRDIRVNEARERGSGGGPRGGGGGGGGRRRY